MYPEARILIAGEAGLVVEFSERVERAANLAARLLDARLAEAIGAACPDGGALRGTVVTYRSLLVLYEPQRLRGLDLPGLLAELAREALREAFVAGGGGTGDSLGRPAGRLVELPVCYEGELAPDLGEVADLVGRSPAEVVRLHSAGEYLVYMMGFQIGYPYLASLPPELRLPRLTKPRLKTPQGSVAIAGELTGIYSLTSPGGWRVLGTTPVRLWDLDWSPPTLLEAGDRVRFVPVGREKFERMKAARYVPAGLVRSSPGAAGAACAGAGGEQGGEQGGAAAGTSHPAIRVHAPGILATVQDLGRPGFWRHGLGPGGAMDRFAVRVGNRLLGQAESAAAIEVTAGAARFEFLRAVEFAWTGAAGALRLGDRQIEPWTVVGAEVGDVLEVGWYEQGARGYLCLAGGVAVAPVLGSRSTNLAAGFGGYGGRALRGGDVVEANEVGGQAMLAGRKADRSVIEAVYGGGVGVQPVSLALVPGPQDDAFGGLAWEALLTSEYRIGNDSNRMGYRLDGPAIAAQGGHDIVSDGLTEGAVQVPGNGQPVLLMADHQTTGGYPKIGVVAAADLPRAAQAWLGQRVRFERCDVETATQRRLALDHAVGEAVGEIRRMELMVGPQRYTVTVDGASAPRR